VSSIVDVAKKAGVSISTVSHVINGTKYVSPNLSERVNNAIKLLGYQANDVAASMKKHVTNNIGVILQNIGMIFFPEVLAGIEKAAKENGYKLFYFSSNFDFAQEQQYLSLLKKSWVDGIVIDSCCSKEIIEDYQKRLVANVPGHFVPVVTLETPFTEKGLGVITIDQVKYTFEAVEYLIKMRHRRIGLLLGPEYLPLHSDNHAGYLAAHDKYGIEPMENYLMHGDYFAESGYKAVRNALEEGTNWTALYVANDQMAIGAMKAIKEKGLSIPQDIAVIGADGIFVNTLIEPSLTSVELPKYEMGYKSVQMLVDMIQNRKTVGEHIRMEGKMVIRKSTDASVSEDWNLTGW